MSEIGKKIWVFPGAYLPAKGNPYKTTFNGDQFGYEPLCIVNNSKNTASLRIDFLFEDNEPVENYKIKIDGKKSLHLRLDNIKINGMTLPRENGIL
tara:strand:- start:1714 stop:2001 length:288 start_codon:yes stop_codon:yes gene_type:complete